MAEKFPFLNIVETSLALLDEKPQVGIPPFPLHELEKALSSRFELTDLKITYEEKGWVKKPIEGSILAIYASSINSPFFWTMSEKDERTLFESFFNLKEEASYFMEDSLGSGLYQFAALTVLKEIDHLKFAEFLNFNLGKVPKSTLEVSFYKIDVTLTTRNQVFSGSLFFPEDFRNEWKRHFAKYHQFVLTDEMKKKLNVDLSVEIGYSEVNIDEFKKIKLGDFLVLDHSSYDSTKKEGTAVLTLNGEAIFRGKLKPEGIKLLDFPRLEEAVKTMADENFEIEEPITEALPNEKREINLEKLPLHVSVEIARLKMTLEELSNLSSGSLLELPIKAEEGVALVINGKIVGKGDLIKIGETVGVRITSL